jgi:hypothetical protein
MNHNKTRTSLKRSQRSRRFAIYSDYDVYTSVDIESDEIYMREDIDAEGHSTTYEEAMRSEIHPNGF